MQPIAPKVHCSPWDAARIHVISVGHIVPMYVLYKIQHYPPAAKWFAITIIVCCGISNI